MHLILNSKTQQGMWRVDDLDNGRTGVEFMMHPTALVESKELAELICRLINSPHELCPWHNPDQPGTCGMEYTSRPEAVE
jgi:hypothetical protein